jgi:hypothetical protein
MNIKNPLPLPLLVIGGAVGGYVVTWLLLTLLNNLAFIIGPLIGAFLGWTFYKRNAR